MSDADNLEVLVHELKSPVAALGAILEAVRLGGRSQGERRALLDVAIRACGDVERLVADASLFSLRREHVSLGQVAGDVVASSGRSNGVAVDFVSDRGLPPVSGDPVRLRQVVANLVANAVAHAPTDSEVTVAVSYDREDQTVSVAVTDAGEGIAAGDLQTIFARGVRHAPGRPGAGIGLYVAAAVAAAHDGRIDVASAPDTGTTFTLVLPCFPDHDG
jgi:signal transduction histidine kinase